ncbi:hypothetical protein [Microbacterium sp. No. 7]|uniref:hypothetical protein n=1 Tax=Microbacterium sp. No. 7 TaxID=1714373 RepID=UPI0006ED246B|nr:hypothetical protein [Microbacterium sp. No. 7]ALJ22029.1 hypothetical protein AOA12_19895 [Microbacterium sp. No. 7]
MVERFEPAEVIIERRLATVEVHPGICNVPAGAYGPQRMTWADTVIPVWAWIPWCHKPMELRPGFAKGWNDRVVSLYFEDEGGERYATVWRSAVRLRTVTRD